MKTLGILGGMGPMATACFMERITAMTAADTDQEQIPVIVYSNTQIPDRSAYLLGRPQAENPVTALRQTHRYYPADDEICPRSERQVPAVSTASPWNQRNSFWISVSSATEYPSFWQMDSICLLGIPVFGLFEFKISDIWQQLGYRTKLRTTGLMALPLVSWHPLFLGTPCFF